MVLGTSLKKENQVVIRKAGTGGLTRIFWIRLEILLGVKVGQKGLHHPDCLAKNG